MSGGEKLESAQAQVSSMGKWRVRVNFRDDINTERRLLINSLAGQLNGALNNSTTAVIVDDSAFVDFQQGRRVRVLRVDDELMNVVSVSGNTITVTRGAFGTSATSHDDNAAVILYRQLNIERVYDDTGRSAEMMLDCVEVA